MKRSIAFAVGVSIALLLGCNDDVEFQGQVVPREVEPTKPVTQPLILQETFPSSHSQWNESSYDFEMQTVTQSLRLDEMKTLSATFSQIDRERYRDTWLQGHSGEMVSYSVTLNSGVLDLAIVVDDSASMQTEHEDLKERLADLLSKIDGVDWQMAIGTTTSSCLRPDGTTILSSQTDYETRFGQAVDAGTGGSGEERGLERGAELLQGVCENTTKPWIRDDSLVAVLFISDEDSFCGRTCRGNELPNRFVADMKKIRPGQTDLLRAYALTWNATDCTKDSSESEGTRYRDVVDAIGGLTLPICKDFSDVLRQISNDVASVLERKFTLKHTPTQGSLTVAVGGQPYTNFTLNGAEVTLGLLPPGEQTIDVTYRHSPTEKTDTYFLTKTAAPHSLVVKVDGVEVDSADYDFDASVHKVVLHSMPADNAVIDLAYRLGVALPNAFDLSHIGDLVNLTSVTIDGESISDTDFSYDAVSMELRFVNPPKDASTIQIVYAKDDLRSEYPLRVSRTNAVEHVKAKDRNLGDEFEIVFDGDSVTIPMNEISSGRELDIVFVYSVDTWLPDFELPEFVVDNSLVVLSGDDQCEHSFSDQGALMFACADSPSTITVGYETVTSVSELKLSQVYPDNADFDVTIGDLSIAFTRSEDILRLVGEIPAEQEILVTVNIATE